MVNPGWSLRESSMESLMSPVWGQGDSRMHGALQPRMEYGESGWSLGDSCMESQMHPGWGLGWLVQDA